MQLPQVWSFAQSYLKDSFDVLCESKGNPLGYDIEVTRFGTKEHTRYGLKGFAPTKLNEGIKSIMEYTPINLYALYVGKKPFLDLEAGLEFKDEDDNDTDVA